MTQVMTALMPMAMPPMAARPRPDDTLWRARLAQRDGTAGGFALGHQRHGTESGHRPAFGLDRVEALGHSLGGGVPQVGLGLGQLRPHLAGRAVEGDEQGVEVVLHRTGVGDGHGATTAGGATTTGPRRTASTAAAKRLHWRRSSASAPRPRGVSR